MEEQEQKQRGRKGQTVLLIALTLAVLGCLALCALTFYSTKETSAAIDRLINGSKDVAQENDITIADIYTIESTTHISDAYKSGETDKLSNRDKETLKMASAVLDKIIKKDMTAYDKEEAVYKWMLKNLNSDAGVLVAVPTSDEDSANPYGVLKNHKAVCVGYATTFRLFMEMLDIECMVIHNSERFHSWNLVKLDDGCWYHVDVYSDIDGADFADFNLSDTQYSNLKADTWNMDFFPRADGIKYNYAYNNSKKVKDIYKIPSLVLKSMDKEENALYLNLGSDISKEKIAILQSMMSSLSSRIEEMTMTGDDSTDNYISYGFSQVKGEYLLNIAIYGNSDDSEDVSPEEMDKILKAIDKAFEKYFDYQDFSY